ncbi:hypothetical protein [Nannocystis bainbridge]|uniref:Transposase n=1 Tax=Nannocystis bainbridge TaxID=2995303 RepID=A0ABT5DRA2_9BACT|nr:hypothetical protein [Nannocystis bainbridge]MDC0715685.1 hypothetical protein [Nannocystis bainbridge]
MDAPLIPVKTDVPSTSSLSTRTALHSLLTTRRAEFARCPDAPTQLTLAIDVGPKVVLAEIQHVAADPEEPLDRGVGAIINGLALPPSAPRHASVSTLGLSGD